MTEIELKQRLHGCEEVQVRLDVAEKAFLAAINAPVSQKEDVVVLWLSHLLTAKVVALTTEEQIAAWTTLSNLLNSQRLEALCSINWVCPITTSFIDTLVDVISSSCDSVVRGKAVNVCHSLMQNSSLAPLVTHSLTYCLLLSKGLMTWLLEGHRDSVSVRVTTLMITEVAARMQGHTDKMKVMTSVSENLLLLSGQVAVSAKDDEGEEMQLLLKELKALMSASLFHTELTDHYSAAFTLLLSETKAVVPDNVMKFLQLIVAHIENEAIEVTQFLLAEIYSQFTTKFRVKKTLQCQFLAILCHALSIRISNPKVPSVVENSFAAQRLRASSTDARKRETLLHSLVQVIHQASQNIAKDSELDLLLKTIAETTVTTTPTTPHGYQCLQILLALIPQHVSNLVTKSAWILYPSKTPDDSELASELYRAYDELLCDVLQVCIKLRNLPKMFEKFLLALRENRANLGSHTVISGTMDAQEQRLFFPPLFVALVRRTVCGLSDRQVLPVWKAILSFLTKECSLLLKAQAKGGALEFVSVVLLLLSVVMESSPALHMATLGGDAVSLANVMAQIGTSGIKPLATVMLTQPHNNTVCGSFLMLCHTWGELHTDLLITEVGYRECPLLPKMGVFTASPATDFSHLFPFIPPDAWAQISARVANFGDKAAKLALIRLVIQKLSQASLEKHRGTFGEGSSVECTGKTVTQKTIDSASKYLTNAMESWGSDVSCLFISHLAYLVPLLHTSHLSVIARQLVSGVREEQKSWSEYVNSRHFEEASALHPLVFSEICSVLATMFSSSKRKLSECEDGPASSKNYAHKLLKKVSKCVPLLAESESAEEKQNAVWETLVECGDYLTKQLEREENQSTQQRSHTSELKTLVQLLTKLPLEHLNKTFKTAVHLVLFSLLVEESYPGREEHFSDLIYALNQTLGYSGTFKLFAVTKASSLMRWLIEKRALLYGSTLSQHLASLPHALLKTNRMYTPKFMDTPNPSADVSNLYNFDHLLVYVAFKLMWVQSVVAQIKEVTNYITTTDAIATESLLQPAVILLAAAHLRWNAHCQQAKQELSEWILRYVKKTDLNTTSPTSAASVLTAHTILVQTLAPTLTDSARNRGKSHDVEEDKAEVVTSAEDTGKKLKRRKRVHSPPKEAKSGEETDVKEEVVMPTEDTGKKLKWRKRLGDSIQLSELCLSSGNKELEEYALTFLLTLANHAEVLNTYLPPHLLSTAWTALSVPERCPSDMDACVTTKVSLEPVLQTSTSEDYEKLLEDLVTRTHRGGEDLDHTLRLWRLVIASTATRTNGFLKRTALEHLIPILVNLSASYSPSAGCDYAVLHSVLVTLQEIINTSINFQDQTKAHLLVPCAALHFHKLPHHQFCQIFNTVVGIVNTVVVNHESVVVDRTPSLLAALTHIITSLITKANQELKLTDKQIKDLVGCGSNVERVVKELSPFKVKLNKVVHFTTASIVTALQHTTVYPAVKAVIESVVYRLLDLCDVYCLQHLLVALPPAATTLLKHLHDNYTTFHRYNPGKA